LHQIGGDAGGVVAGYASLFQIVSQDGDHAQGLDGIEIGNDPARTLERVLRLEFIGYGCAVDQSIVKYLLSGMTVEGADVIGGSKAEALVCLVIRLQM